MEDISLNRKANSLDIIKTVCCVLIVASHCLPIFTSAKINYYYGQWFFRFCVPFFFMSSGYYFARMNEAKSKAYIRRIMIIYVVSSIAYLPAYAFDSDWKQILLNLIFGYYHLWYLNALAVGLIIVKIAHNHLKRYKYIMLPLLLGGVLLGTYYKLFDEPAIDIIVKGVSYIGGARHALFFAVPLILVGEGVAEYNIIQVLNRRKIIIGFVCALILSFVEATLLKCWLGETVRLDVTFFGWMPAVPLLFVGLITFTNMIPERSRKLRKITDLVYIIHIGVLMAVNHFTECIFFSRFMLVTVISFALAYLMETVLKKLRTNT